MPDLDDLYNMYKDQEYIHLHMDLQESKATVQNWIAAHTYEATHWPIDPGTYWNIMWHWTNSNGIPQHFVFDRDGRLRWDHVGCIAAPYGQGAATISPIIDELI
jgi:hypothetical protein